MRSVKVNCVVTCDYKPTLELQGKPVNLDKKGKDASGPSDVVVGDDELVLIHLEVGGIEGEKWSVDIKTDCPGGTPNEFYSDSGTIPHGGSYEYYLRHRMPLTVCKSGSATDKGKLTL